MSIRIVLADHHDMVREGIKSLLDREPDYTVIGEARDGHESVRLVGQINPDIVVMDLYMSHLSGIEATKQICARGNRCRVIGLSSCNDQRAIGQMLAAGAAACVFKSQPFYELCRAINLIHNKQQYQLPRAVRAPIMPPELQRPNVARLSKRERQTLALIADGKSSKEIAGTLCVCIKTVEAHRHTLRQKLGCPSIAQLTRFAIQEGLAEATV